VSNKEMDQNRMRACVLAYAFYENDYRVLRYAEALARRGDQVDVIALRSPTRGFHEVINGVHVYRVQGRIKNEKRKFSYLFRIIKFLLISGLFLSWLHMKHRYDLVHVHSVPDFLVFGAIVPKLCGAKIILDIHDILPEFYASKFGRGQDGLMFKLMVQVEKISIGFSDHVIIANHIWKKKLETRSTRSSKCTAIINYPDRDIFYPREQGCKNNEFTMVYPGSISWHQGLDIAVKAFALIKDRVPNLYFYIYGGGTAGNQLSDLIDQLGLKGRVFLDPGKTIREIAIIIARADLGIVPKRNDQFGGEAFSTKTLEFMSSGVPIIVAKTKVDQYYFDESLVKFFEPDNVEDLAGAMLTMVRDKNQRDRLSKNGLEFAKKNTWDGKKHIYLDLVDELVGKDRGQKSEGRDRDKDRCRNNDRGRKSEI
jgi:glycosyltransferase involved in cell wall biosynthesis